MVSNMRKKFKTRTNSNKFQIIIILILIYLSFKITYSILFEKIITKYIDSTTLIHYLINNGINTNTEDIEDIINFNLKEPINLLNYSFNNLIDIVEEKEETLTTLIEDPSDYVVEEPLIYIYNSHQLENYNMEYLEAYNIRPNVMMASYILREKLNDLNLKTIVETNSVKDILTKNNWKYSYSYKASRQLLEQAKKDHPSLKYFIDLHRDSSKKEKTTITIDGTNYAKVLFVVGKEHPNYQENLNLTTKINNKIKEYNINLSRGIYLKEGVGVNGIYNQDFSPNTILIELGGQDNTIEEVTNTINILSKILFELLGDENA